MLKINLPSHYSSLQSLPEDPKDSTSYGMQTPNALCMVLSYPIPLNKTMPLNKEQIVEGVRYYLAENQGIIQVECGHTKEKMPFIYSIVKNISNEGALYILTMHVIDENTNEAWAISGQFQEFGTTGVRDAAVYEYARRNELVDEEGNGWMKDPYDENFTFGIRMNLSEVVDFDAAFPTHPLSQLRELVNHIIENN